MTVEENQFMKACRGFAESFLQTVVVIDDEAYLQETEPKAVELTRPDPRGQSLDNEQANPESSDDQRELEVESEDKAAAEEGEAVSRRPSSEHELDAKKLIDSFADRGLVCAVISPGKDEDLSASFVNVARRSDVTIVDWLINKDDGKLAKSIIKEILHGDRVSGGRLRLIVVYTGEPDLVSIRDGLSNELREFGLEEQGDSALQSKQTRIAILPKADGNDNTKSGYTESELPKATVDEFLALAKGLLPNAALGAISALRDDTHKILARFHEDLDGAFLTHRILHTTPGDSEKFLIELLCDEFYSVLESHEVVKRIGTQDVLEGYVDFIREKMDKDELVLIRDAGRDPTEAVRLEDVKVSVDGGINSIPETWRKKSLFKRIYPLFYRDVAEGKKHHLEFGRLSSLCREAYGDVEMRTSFVPTLRLGSILCDGNQPPKYFACIQPACDCLRITGITPFIFSVLESVDSTVDKGFDFVVVGRDRKVVKLKSVVKPSLVQIFKFDGSPFPDGRIRSTQDVPDYVFTTANADPLEAVELFWIGDLRGNIAARLAHEVASELSRVGPDEYEWQRLSK